MNAARLAQKPVGMLLGAGAAMVAGAALERAWRAATGVDHVPRATELDVGWGQVLIAAGLQGAVFAVVKAAVDRASAQGVRRITGQTPG